MNPLLSTAPLMEARSVGVGFDVSGGWLAPPRRLQAVRNLSFKLHRGEVLGIVGESGCGKSTLAMTMLNLTRPTEGEVRLDGIALAQVPRSRLARRVQPVFQDPYSSLNPTRRVSDAILQPLRIHGIGSRGERQRLLGRIMDLVGLPERLGSNFPDQLSGGQRQRVAIARALIMQPEILICDEPTSALDVSVQAQVLNLLRDLRDRFGLTYVFISHNLAVVEYIATRVMVMYLGRIVEQAPAAELFARPRHPYTAALLGAILTPDPELGLPENTPGEYPDPISPPPGCPFHPRCSHAIEKCRNIEPPDIRIGDTIAACHLLDAG